MDALGQLEKLLLLSALCFIFCNSSRQLKHWRNQINFRKKLLENGLGRTPQMGVKQLSDSLPARRTQGNIVRYIEEKLIKETADAMVSTGLAVAALGYEYINLDDCWAELNRDSQGNLVAKGKTFPSGIKALADYVHGKGLKLGIYTDAEYCSTPSKCS